MSPPNDRDQCRREVSRILSGLGVEAGDLIYLGIDMAHVPLPAFTGGLSREAIQAHRENSCRFLLDAIREHLGPEGTLLAPSFSYSMAGPEMVYHHEDTPSENGPFTEFIRSQPDAVRSLHPMFSVSGLGPKAPSILENCGKAAFGALSPFARLQQNGCKFVCLGTRISHSLTFIHHLEQTYGCNNRYHKVLSCDVFREGVRQPGPWLAYLAFLSLEAEMQCLGFENELASCGALRQFDWNGSQNQLVLAEDAARIGYRMLTDNPCSFMTADVTVVLDEPHRKSIPADRRVASFDIVPKT